MDNRHRDARYPVNKVVFPQQSWANTKTDAKTVTLANLNGMCEQIEVKVSNATNGITFTVAGATSDGGVLFSKAAIAENGTTVLKATSDATDFDAFLVDGSMTVTITPSGDPGASGVTVDVNIYLR